MNKFSKYSDIELVIAFSKKKSIAEIAFAEFYSRYSDTLYMYLRKMIKNEEDISDIFQDIMLKFFKNAKIKKSKLFNPRGYLFVIARTVVYNFYRDNIPDHIEYDDKFHYVENSNYSDKQLIELLEEQIQKLSIDEREIFIMRIYQGFKNKEIAEITKKDEGLVRNKLYRARKKIIKLMSPYLKEIKRINKIVLE